MSTTRPRTPPRNALATPRATPTITETSTAPPTSESVTASRVVSSCPTASDDLIDRPKSPCTARLSQCQYWVHSGWSSLSCLRNASYCSGLALMPRIERAASPGTRLARTNVSTETPKTSGTAVNSHRITSLRIPDALLRVVPVERAGDRRGGADRHAAEVRTGEVEHRAERHRGEPGIVDEVLLHLLVERGAVRGGSGRRLVVERDEVRGVRLEPVEHRRGRQEEPLPHQVHRRGAVSHRD